MFIDREWEDCAGKLTFCDTVDPICIKFYLQSEYVITTTTRERNEMVSISFLNPTLESYNNFDSFACFSSLPVLRFLCRKLQIRNFKTF